eukprot:4029986-Prymnesium_polylepis.1
MAAASGSRRMSGFLRRSELVSLLRRANATMSLSNAQLEAALGSSKKHLAGDTPLQSLDGLRALGVDGFNRKELNAQQVSTLLLELCTSSTYLAELFARYAVDNKISQPQWRAFVRAEHLVGDENESESLAALEQSDSKRDT